MLGMQKKRVFKFNISVRNFILLFHCNQFGQHYKHLQFTKNDVVTLHTFYGKSIAILDTLIVKKSDYSLICTIPLHTSAEQTIRHFPYLVIAPLVDFE